MKFSIAELKEFLDEKAYKYNQPAFIESDPISIPHQFTAKEDIEISGFLAATIAWGQRTTIIKNANRLMEYMDHEPHNFILNHSREDLKPFHSFVHRTFNGVDCVYFIKALHHIYTKHNGLEAVFTKDAEAVTAVTADALMYISSFRKTFFELPEYVSRTEKHVSNPEKGSSAKRLNMFLRWMVRKDNCGVDFGLWNTISPALLVCPLDVHTGNVGRKLGLLNRTQNDWKSAMELTQMLRKMNAEDPVKYDFALFGLGVFEKF